MAISAQTPLQPFTEREADAWVGFLRSHATLVRELDATLSEAHGLPLSSYEVLLRLSREPEGQQRMSDLAESVWLSRSGITRLIDRLERDGLVERRACASDARGSYAVITDEGRRRLDAARATHVADVRERFLSRFTADEQARLTEFWSRLG
jgi:DNA-binding MarR family transcriptional regulator